MTVAGSQAPPGGGAPVPDADRVAAIRATITDEAGACATFAEAEHTALTSLNTHTLARARDGDLGECLMLLGHVRDRVAALDPERLQPRRGLAGLFDSRGARLKAFRAAWVSTASAVGDAAADLGTRGGAIATRHTALENLWAETRDAIAALDVPIAAARAWLADRPSPRPVIAPGPDDLYDPVEPQADAEAAHASGPVEVREAGPDIPTLPHPLAARLVALEAVRAVALGRLPLLRAAQNADCGVPARIREVCDGIQAWQADWRDALGLAGRKPKKVQPDPARLIQARTALTDGLARAEQDLKMAGHRRDELNTRTAPDRDAPRQAA
ncbi:MAG: hypothetical protein Q8S03_02920 [Brevundimonas sp.]|uniref:hypothetical protein n=1 Tax=Brevundimonas sp. TaxID=1871086 RepID=UPI0027331049|nr:hypothetical protein [Brevundimonas sp.]MDP3403614.1 hypothetical protein [Brevundimonas sp.]